MDSRGFGKVVEHFRQGREEEERINRARHGKHLHSQQVRRNLTPGQ